MSRRPTRGADVPPPSADGEWRVKYATKEALDLPEIERRYPGPVGKAKAHLRRHPDRRTDVCKPLKGALGARTIAGKVLTQWQCDISAAGRIWYCPDPDARIVWVTLASAGHPQGTQSKGRGRPTTR